MNIFNSYFYINSPVAVQKFAVFAHGFICKMLRGGRLFKNILSSLEKSQWYSEEELKELQKEKLRIMVKHAYENVPYYRILFNRLHLKPDDIKGVHDLYKLPVISKQEVRENLKDFLAVNINKNFTESVFTSGTTGSPLKVYRDLYSINFENATLKRQQIWAGFKNGGRKMVMRSPLVVNANIRKPPFWRQDFFQKALIASAFHLSVDNIDFYAREISRYSPDALDTLPSIGYFFGKILESKRIEVNFKYVFTSSEVLSGYKKEFMESEFKCRVFDHYGTAERVCAIGMCEKGSYHVYPEHSIAEFLESKDRPGNFEIVGTGLNNFIMPLLRYSTGDIAKVSSKKCACGRNFKTIDSIEGRTTDKFFVASDGRMISLFTPIISMDIKGVLEVQFIQERIGELLVKAAVDNRYSSAEESKLIESIKRYLGKDVRLNLEKVPFIPRDAGGKFRQFISNVNGFNKTEED